MALFLCSLSILFLAGMLGLIYLRVNATGPAAGPSQGIPARLWWSTLLLILSSITISRAAAAARRGRQPALRLWLVATVTLALGFLVNQVPALTVLLERHFAMLHELSRAAAATQPAFVSDPRRYLFGLVFFLIIIHALHVIGGLVALGVAAARAFTGPGTPATAVSVRFTAVYWHFLDVVWLVMFVGFLTL
jgi:heme/copper-type cytochrome/quinol oxidase subunit 3